MIVRKLATVAGIGMLALTSPGIAYADDHTANREAAFVRAMADAFAADPLTAEQEARVPAAVQVVDKVFPQGTYRRMMDESFEPMMNSIFGSSSTLSIAGIATLAGLTTEEVKAMGDTTVGEVMAIIDPVFEERTALTTGLTLELMDGIVDEIEPPLRAGLARAYAVHFTDTQLAELNAFFQTETGSYYAGESFIIFTDPQVMSAMQEMMPAMMKMVPELTQKMEQRMAALPPMRKYSDLSEGERDRLAELLGMTREQMDKKQGGFFSGSATEE